MQIDLQFRYEIKKYYYLDYYFEYMDKNRTVFGQRISNTIFGKPSLFAKWFFLIPPLKMVILLKELLFCAAYYQC